MKESMMLFHLSRFQCFWNLELVMNYIPFSITRLKMSKTLQEVFDWKKILSEFVRSPTDKLLTPLHFSQALAQDEKDNPRRVRLVLGRVL